MLLLNLLLALVWVALTGSFTPQNLLLGFVLAYGVLWITSRGRPPSRYFSQGRRLAEFTGFFLWELLLANLRVAYDVATPRFYMRPGVVAIPLDARSPEEITLLANLITLTPGTLSLDVSPDRSVLYIHAMYLDEGGPDALRRRVKEGFERRVIDLLR
jgi:multicomponent Na+:H+ antiporter subunit E